MDGRSDDVEGLFVGELDDDLAQVRLDHFDAGRLQGGVQADLLGQQRLGFDDQLGAPLPRQRQHVRPSLLRRSGKVDHAAALLDIGGELVDVVVEVLDSV